MSSKDSPGGGGGGRGGISSGGGASCELPGDASPQAPLAATPNASAKDFQRSGDRRERMKESYRTGRVPTRRAQRPIRRRLASRGAERPHRTALSPVHRSACSARSPVAITSPAPSPYAAGLDASPPKRVRLAAPTTPVARVGGLDELRSPRRPPVAAPASRCAASTPPSSTESPPTHSDGADPAAAAATPAAHASGDGPARRRRPLHRDRHASRHGGARRARDRPRDTGHSAGNSGSRTPRVTRSASCGPRRSHAPRDVDRGHVDRAALASRTTSPIVGSCARGHATTRRRSAPA